MEMKLDYSDVAFRNDGKLKLLIIVGTRRRSSVWRRSSTSAANILTAFSPTRGRITIIT